jgi:predicted O-methyltransferase YrrM
VLTIDDSGISGVPSALAAIVRDTDAIGFRLASDPQAGALLSVLAASKPHAHLLELGTGTGVGTAWLLAGMRRNATLLSVDHDEEALAIAKRHLGADPRVTFRHADAEVVLDELTGHHFDLIYADAWPGKFTHLDAALRLLAPGGLYVIDDLLPQANWPDGHGSAVPALIADLESRRNLRTVRLAWSSGLLVAVRVSP